jgi:ribulose-phosphate 3-epimerase
MTHQLKIAPSLLSCDFSNLETEVKNCERFGADILHVDVMDGHFVPNITIGPLIVKAIRPHSSLPIDCHLMISNPDNYIDDFADAGADFISVHAEVCNHLHRTLSKIKERNCKSGVVLNPITPLQYAFDAAEYCDFILLMSVNPGFGGQSFISSFLDKCKTLRDYLDSNGLSHVEIEVDGGVKIDNIRQVVDAGANMIVSGSGLFKGNFEQNIKDMKLAAISGQ